MRRIGGILSKEIQVRVSVPHATVYRFARFPGPAMVAAAVAGDVRQVNQIRSLLREEPRQHRRRNARAPDAEQAIEIHVLIDCRVQRDVWNAALRPATSVRTALKARGGVVHAASPSASAAIFRAASGSSSAGPGHLA